MSSKIAAGTEGPDRIFVCGHPHFKEATIREFLECFGPLKVFNLIEDRSTVKPLRFGFCAYQDPSVTDIACATLNGIQMDDKKLTVRRATEHAIQPKIEEELRISLQKLMIQP